MSTRCLLLTLLCACAGARTPPPAPECSRVESVAWLRGRWCGDHEGGTFCEAWRDDGGRALAGTGDFERGGARVFAESLRVEERGGAVYYVASPEGQATTAFRLVTCSATEAVFENPAHDFPTRIAYRRSGDALVAVVEGPSDGAVRRSTFALTRRP